MDGQIFMRSIVGSSPGGVRSGRRGGPLLESSPTPVKPHRKDVLCRAKSPQEVRPESVFLIQDPQGESRGDRPRT